MSWSDTLSTSASGWTILVRLLVGAAVFIPEGLQKLMFPDIRGALDDALARISRIEQALGLADLAAYTAPPPPKS